MGRTSAPLGPSALTDVSIVIKKDQESASNEPPSLEALWEDICSKSLERNTSGVREGPPSIDKQYLNAKNSGKVPILKTKNVNGWRTQAAKAAFHNKVHHHTVNNQGRSAKHSHRFQLQYMNARAKPKHSFVIIEKHPQCESMKCKSISFNLSGIPRNC